MNNIWQYLWVGNTLIQVVGSFWLYKKQFGKDTTRIVSSMIGILSRVLVQNAILYFGGFFN